MSYQIIDNFLSIDEYKEIKNFILQDKFPWNFTPIVTSEKEKLPFNASYYFTHLFWYGFYVEEESQIFAPIVNKIECKSMIRIKSNLYPSTEKIIHHDNHIDYDYAHRSAIFYLNSNNGLTVLEDKVEVNSVENRLLFFDGSKIHRSTTCSDSKCRVNINFNFF